MHGLPVHDLGQLVIDGLTVEGGEVHLLQHSQGALYLFRCDEGVPQVL